MAGAGLRVYSAKFIGQQIHGRLVYALSGGSDGRIKIGDTDIAQSGNTRPDGGLIADQSDVFWAVQDAYSLRCAPQVHGAVADTLDFLESVLTREMASVVDNPIVFPETGEREESSGQSQLTALSRRLSCLLAT